MREKEKRNLEVTSGSGSGSGGLVKKVCLPARNISELGFEPGLL